MSGLCLEEDQLSKQSHWESVKIRISLTNHPHLNFDVPITIPTSHIECQDLLLPDYYETFQLQDYFPTSTPEVTREILFPSLVQWNVVVDQLKRKKGNVFLEFPHFALCPSRLVLVAFIHFSVLIQEPKEKSAHAVAGCRTVYDELISSLVLHHG